MHSGHTVGHLLFSRAHSVVILQLGGCVRHARSLIVLTATHNFTGVVQVWHTHVIAWATTRQRISSVTNISSEQSARRSIERHKKELARNSEPILRKQAGTSDPKIISRREWTCLGSQLASIGKGKAILPATANSLFEKLVHPSDPWAY